MNHLDLFSGIGGFSIAAESAGFETVAFCEIDPEASIITRHFWPHVPNLTDIHTVTRDRYPHLVPDLITGGVPCQPASALGLMRGTSDERWLWPETIRIMREFRPRFGVFENPPALLTLESGDAWNGIVSGLVALGYDLWWDVFPAAAFGAGHLRERVILVASDSSRQRVILPSNGEIQAGRNAVALRCGCGEASPSNTDRERWPEAWNSIPSGASHGSDVRGQSTAHDCEALAPHSDDSRLQGYPEFSKGGSESRWFETRPKQGHASPPDLRGRVTGPDWWHEAHTGIPVLATGIPTRVVEAVSRCIGNSVVPQAIVPVMEAIAATFATPTQNPR